MGVRNAPRTGSEGRVAKAASLPGRGTLRTKKASGSIRDHAPGAIEGTTSSMTRGKGG